MVKITKWDEVKARRYSVAEIAARKTAVRVEAAAITLAELREAAGKTQMEFATESEMAQSELSRFERRDDQCPRVGRGMLRLDVEWRRSTSATLNAAGDS